MSKTCVAGPREWSNLAAKPEPAAVISQHRKWLPQTEAEPVPALKQQRKNTAARATLDAKVRPI